MWSIWNYYIPILLLNEEDFEKKLKLYLNFEILGLLFFLDFSMAWRHT